MCAGERASVESARSGGWGIFEAEEGRLRDERGELSSLLVIYLREWVNRGDVYVYINI